MLALSLPNVRLGFFQIIFKIPNPESKKTNAENKFKRRAKKQWSME